NDERKVVVHARLEGLGQRDLGKEAAILCSGRGLSPVTLTNYTQAGYSAAVVSGLGWLMLSVFSTRSGAPSNLDSWRSASRRGSLLAFVNGKYFPVAQP